MDQLILGNAEYKLYIACGSEFRIHRYLTSSKMQALCFSALFIAVGRILNPGWLFYGLLMVYALLTLLELRGFSRAGFRYRCLLGKIMDVQQRLHGVRDEDASCAALADSISVNGAVRYKKALFAVGIYAVMLMVSACLSSWYADVLWITALLGFVLYTLQIKLEFAHDIICWKRMIRQNGTELVNANVEICVQG